MKKIILIFSTLLMLLFIECKDKRIYKVEGSFNVKYEYDTLNIESIGFKKQLTDILLFEKKVSDTIISLEFNKKINTIRSISWRIAFNSTSIVEINDFLLQNNIFALSPMCLFDEKNRDEGGSFIGIRYIDNNVFYCSISIDEEDKSKSILSVIYHKPLLREDLEKSIKEFKKHEIEQKEYRRLNSH